MSADDARRFWSRGFFRDRAILTGQFYRRSGIMATMDKRNAIMRAAESLFATRRFHEVTLDVVAQEAHVGKGTIYRYFADKDDLFFQIETDAADELCRLIREAGGTDGDFRERLLAVAERVYDFFRRRHQIFRMMHDPKGRGPCFNGDRHERFMEQKRRIHTAVAEILGKAGSEDGADVPLRMRAVFFLALFGARARDFEADDPDTPSLSQILDLFLYGVAGRAD